MSLAALRLGPLLAAVMLFGCQTRIQQDLDERQANELQTVLIERGFGARKVPQAGKKPTWSIEVREEQAPDAVRVLAELGLPRPKAPTTFEVLGSGGLVPTPGEERSRQLLGLSGDLVQTLETVEGVASARVHLVMPQPARPGQTTAPAKASALLRVRPGSLEKVNQGRDELRALIAGSVEGLGIEQVTLVVSEVSTSVPMPKAGGNMGGRLRALVVGLGLLVSALSLAMVGLTLRLRHYRAAAPAGWPVSASKPERKVA